MDRAGNGARTAGLRPGDIGINERVHAGVLQRGEEPENEDLDHDEPDRSARADGGKQHDHQAKDDRIGNQYPAITQAPQDARHGYFQTHGGNRLRHHHQTGLNGGEPEAHLVQEREKKGDATNAQARKKTAADGRPESADPEQGQPEQGKFDASSMPAVSGEKK